MEDLSNEILGDHGWKTAVGNGSGKIVKWTDLKRSRSKISGC